MSAPARSDGSTVTQKLHPILVLAMLGAMACSRSTGTSVPERTPPTAPSASASTTPWTTTSAPAVSAAPLTSGASVPRSGPPADVRVVVTRERKIPADEDAGRWIDLYSTTLRVELRGGLGAEVTLGCPRPQPLEPSPRNVAVKFVAVVTCYSTGMSEFLGVVEKTPGNYLLVTWQEEELTGPDSKPPKLALANLTVAATVRASPGLVGPAVVSP